MPQTMHKPIDGSEIKKIMLKQFERWMDSLYLLKPYSAFNKAVIKIRFELSCVPADVPVPKTSELAIEFLPKHFEQMRSQFKAFESTIDELEHWRNEIDEILDVVNPVFIRTNILEAGNVPDNLRIAHGLPCLSKEMTPSGIKEVEIMVDSQNVRA